MAVYLIVFALSLAFIAIGEKKKTLPFILLSAFALLIPCLIAGLRSANIGTDVLVYLKPITHSAINADNFREFMSSYWFSSWHNVYVKDYEIAFSAVVYLVAKLTGSLYAVQFVIEALMILPIYIALARNRKQFPLWLGMLVFYLFFYNSTLNLLRQWIAMAFLLLAFQMLREQKWLCTAIFTLIGICFHSSALLVAAIYVILWVLYLCRKTTLVHNNLRISAPMIVTVLVFALSMVLILNIDVVFRLLKSLGSNRFANYLNGGPVSLLMNQVILRLPFFVLFAINWKDFRRHSKYAVFYLCMLLLDVVIAQLISVAVYSFRIGYFFTMYLLFAIPELHASISSPVKRNTTTALLGAYFLFYWYYTYVLQLRHETYPYVFL